MCESSVPRGLAALIAVTPTILLTLEIPIPLVLHIKNTILTFFHIALVARFFNSTDCILLLLRFRLKYTRRGQCVNPDREDAMEATLQVQVGFALRLST